jgi:hypothetical protein
MSVKNSGKWKDALLKTSLPLEYLVAEKLEKKDFGLWGEFSYTRKNEQGIDTEFSVDIRAVDLLKGRGEDYWGSLQLLIECKYSYPTVKWVFAPHANESTLTLGVVNHFEDLCTRRLSNSDPIYNVDRDLIFCTKGIELHESDANEQSIKRGVHQLRWAIPQLTAEIFRNQATTLHDGDLQIEFFCPILVTNAPLYVFRRRLNIRKFQIASDLEEIAEKVDALIVHQERGPQLNSYIRQIVNNLYKEVPSIKERLGSLWPLIRTPDERRHLPSTWSFEQTIDSLSTRVLVVNLDAFDGLINDIHSSVKEAGRKLRRVAVLKKAQNAPIARIEPTIKS